jgi:hypothetical protein
MKDVIKIGFAVLAIFVVFSIFNRCGSTNNVTSAPPQQRSVTTETQVILREKAKGLNLAAVTALAKKAKDAAEFEKLLNSQAEGINNIDLNDDQVVDYIKVTEYGTGDSRGFSLTTEIAPGEVQEIATIDFEKKAETVITQTTGNDSLYGTGNFFHSSFGLTDALLIAWMFSNRPTYMSPYGYGNYPPSYGRGWNRDSDDRYADRENVRSASATVTRTDKPVIKQPAVSPNAEKTAAKARALTTATKSQRSFSSPSSPSSTSKPSSTANKPPSSGGFGRPSGSTSSGSSKRSSSSGSSRSGGSSRRK